MEKIMDKQIEFTNEEYEKLYIPTVCGVGYIGKGSYKVSIKRKHTIEYDRWKGMLRRCYDEKERYKNLTYKEVTVCEEWLCFQDFAKWWHDNYYEIDEQQIQLDKDILYKGNKIYSPNTCIFVPKDINILFTKINNNKSGLPTGVGYDKKRNKYRAYCSIKRKLIAIGNSYETAEDAFYLGYKPFKENHIKEMAEEYKDRIPSKLYNAMMVWKIEITD